MSTILRICIWGLVALVLAAVLLVGINGGNLLNFSFDIGQSGFSTSFNYADAEEYTPGGTSLPAGTDIDTLDIDWVSGLIKLTFTDGDRIVFTESAGRDLDEHEQLYYRVKNGKLTIQYCQSRRGLFTNMPSKTLEVEVPRSAGITGLYIESVSSRVEVDGADMFIREVDIENVSGHVQLQNISARVLDGETVNGHFEAKGAFETVDVESVSGAVTLTFTGMPFELDVETVSGNVRITVPENKGFTAALESVSGSLNCSFADSVSRKKAVYGDGSATFQLETISGSVTIDLDSSLRTPVTPTVPATPEKPSAPESPSVPPKDESAQEDPIPSSGRSF